MWQAFFRNGKGYPHFLTVQAFLHQKNTVEDPDKYHHAKRIHQYHGKGYLLHQRDRRRVWPRHQKDDGHLPHLSHRREQKQLPASDFPRLEFAGKRSPYGALHYGRQGAAYRSKAADVEKIPMDPADQGGSYANVRAAQKPRSHHADDAGVNDCALNRHPDIGGANADHAKNQGKPKPAAECLLFLQQEGPHRWQIGQHGSDQNEKPYIEKQVKKHAVHHYPFSSGNSGPSLAFSVAPACSLGVPSQFLPILQ